MLNPLQGNLGILQGLFKDEREWTLLILFCDGCFQIRTQFAEWNQGATIDFELARLNPSPWAKLVGSDRKLQQFQNRDCPGYSAPAAHQRNYCYADPETAYNELFKSILDPKSIDSENQMLNFWNRRNHSKHHSLQVMNTEAEQPCCIAGFDRQTSMCFVCGFDSETYRILILHTRMVE